MPRTALYHPFATLLRAQVAPHVNTHIIKRVFRTVGNDGAQGLEPLRGVGHVVNIVWDGNLHRITEYRSKLMPRDRFLR